MLSKRFNEYTQHPEYKYATLAYATAGNGDMIIQRNGGGHINVTPRRRVHIYRQQWAWNGADDWKRLAVTVGELGLMWDVLNVMPAIVATNYKFRTSAEYPSAELHSLHTRFMGPIDLLKTGARVTDGTQPPALADGTYPPRTPGPITDIATETRLYKAARVRIKDPVTSNATTTQPMPDSLREWMRQMRTAFPEQIDATGAAIPEQFRMAVINAIPHQNDRPNTLQNVVWIKDMYNHNKHSLQKYEYKNSLFLMHFGSALLHIDQHICCSPQKVLGADAAHAMRLNWVQYRTHHSVPEDVIPNAVTGAGGFEIFIEYDTLKSMRASIRETQDAFSEAWNKRKPSFLNPSAWMTFADTTAGQWRQVEYAQDQVHGTVLHIEALPGAAPAPGADDTALDGLITAFNHYVPEAVD